MIDFEQLADNLNIPILRKAKHTAWLNILVSPLMKVGYWWDKRRYGSGFNVFNASTDYTIYDTVQYGRASYWCIETPAAGLYPLPTDATYWYKILDDYIGLDERSKYSAQKVMLEYALNRRFSPLTITPPFGPTPVSIYIQNNQINTPRILWCAPKSTNTLSWVAPKASTRLWYTTYGSPTLTAQFNFTIYVPAAIYTAISAVPTEADYLISQEVDRYNTAGIKYNIQSY